MSDTHRIQAILEFWFGNLDDAGMCDPARHKLWFQADEATDRKIGERFGADVDAALAGRLDHWAEHADGLIALVVLLDQFTRNIYRGTAQAFSGDSQALAISRAAVATGRHRSLPAIHRVFLYVPYEHAEDLEAQQHGIALVDELLSGCAGEAHGRIADFRRYMVAHRDVIARFGRFPHRNAILDRQSTARELEHLKTHGGF